MLRLLQLFPFLLCNLAWQGGAQSAQADDDAEGGLSGATYGACDDEMAGDCAAATLFFQVKTENVRSSQLAAAPRASVQTVQTGSAAGDVGRSTAVKLRSDVTNRSGAEQALQLEAQKASRTPPAPTLGSISEAEKRFERISTIVSGAFTGMAAGLLLLLIAIPILWMNERAAADMARLLWRAGDEYTSIDADKADKANRGELVHLSGGELQAVGEVAHPHFTQLRSKTGVIHLRTKVQVYHWTRWEVQGEEEKKRAAEATDKEGIEQDQTVRKTGTKAERFYKYLTQWNEQHVDSTNFPEKYQNDTRIHLPVGVHTDTCHTVEYGQGYVVAQDLVEQVHHYRDAAMEFNPFGVGDSLICETMTRCGCHKVTSTFYWEEPDDDDDDEDELTFFYLRKKPGETSVGDMRVSIEYVPDGPATIMALQIGAGAEEENREGFLPYRLIRRGWFGVSDEERKDLLIKQGKPYMRTITWPG
eukprot:TRINITY_DN21310_c0_g1_i2.p1 TRINITY_DN21310_c0_g1~~TRINITY_DN21310_c0_g1_i2.p1  ORF type:complete len:475 (-),score=69.73 TRINITY_DN21310_c0_g1_i2:454-1878(-)